MRCRRAEDLVQSRLAAYPAVALIGARQVGKTTLALGIGGRYYDLEQPGDRTRLDAQWDEVMAHRELVILDEAQSWPDVFPRLRGAIDRDRERNGRILLLGSVSPSLMTQVSESLAGRLSLVELTPFVLGESPEDDLDSLWLRGGLPAGSFLHPQRFPQWQDDYLRLLVQRDLPAWGLPARPQDTSRLVSMLAAVNALAWNATQVSNSLGVSRTTVNSYLDYLEGAFLVRRVHAYRANLRKRLMKTPKLFWRDTGLLHATLGVASIDELLRQPWVGASWESFVINQVLDALSSRGVRVEASYFRTSDQYEIDLVIGRGDELWAVEIKLTSAPSTEDTARLRKVAEMIPCERAVLVCRTSAATIGPQISIVPLRALLDLVVDRWS